jgi:hypothetical protein
MVVQDGFELPTLVRICSRKLSANLAKNSDQNKSSSTGENHRRKFASHFWETITLQPQLELFDILSTSHYKKLRRFKIRNRVSQVRFQLD